MRNLKFSHSFEVVRQLPQAIQPLRDLAYNLRWTWHHETQDLFRDVDLGLWEGSGHNPIELLNAVNASRIEELVQDEVFMARVAKCTRELEDYLNRPTWFDEHYPNGRDNNLIAYFCAEFGLAECLPIYSGGLGLLAGDHLKAASDLGLPLVGVGLLYSRGYFRQYLNPDAWQQEHFPEYDYFRMPVTLVRGPDEQPLRVNVEFPDRLVVCQVWKALVGRIELYLLDSNILENAPADQTITDTLYGGDEEMRIRQESILGIGGFRALSAIGKKPTVCHMNEGHAAFLSLERLTQFMKDHGCDLRTARKCIVAGNVFTTHTPVPAGFDIFTKPLLQKYIVKATEDLGLPFDQFLRLGRIEKDNPTESFNMAVLAMENSNYVNGVSKLHAEVTRGMFKDRWPEYPLDEVPIDSVTNGIHTMSFISPRMLRLLEKYCGPDFSAHASDRDRWAKVYDIPDHELWEVRENERGDFVRFCRRHLKKRVKLSNAPAVELLGANDILDPRALTIGFARRFATYKRAHLLLTDKERLKQILFHPERPVQFVFAGKAHPRDDGGKKLIQDIVKFIRNEGARAKMVFLEDYDISVARALVRGVDVWLNNPRRPLEASGTSGMKVVPNGGLNCSILDGWWAEAFQPGVGWAIGDDAQNSDEGYQDWVDSRALYRLIESDIAPTFYHRTEAGVPSAWVEMMKKSMANLAPTYSTLRMVREYASRFYMPASNAYNRLTQDGLSRAKSALVWRDRVNGSWSKVKVVNVSDTAGTRAGIGSEFKVTAVVELDSLSQEDVRVQVMVGSVTANRELHALTLYDLKHEAADGEKHTFSGRACVEGAGHKGYIVRVIPHHEDVRIPTELSIVAWEQSV